MNEVKIVNPIEQVKAFVNRDTYGFVSSQNIVDVFASKGWLPVQSQFGNVRKLERQGFQKHLVKFEHADFASIDGLSQDNASRPQLVLLNSHDGTGSLRILWGLFRFACLNGIIAGTSLREFKAVHSKNVTNRLGAGIEYMLESLPELLDKVKALQNSTFDRVQLDTYVRLLVDARLSNVRNIQSVNYASALKVLRPQDYSNDAFTILNRIQESVIRGGIEYTYNQNETDINGNVVSSRLVHTRTRRLASIPSQTKLNTLVWDKAIELTKVA